LPTRLSGISATCFLNKQPPFVRHGTTGGRLWVDRAPPFMDSLFDNGQAIRKRTRQTHVGTIVVSDNLSLDGVMQDPAGDEGFERGGWVGLIANRPELGQLALDEALRAEAMLMGRRTYEWFAARWPSRTGELADRLNALPKFVVSSTLADPGWNNATVLTGDLLAEVPKLKQAFDGDIVVPASFRIVRTLLQHDLVDQLRLKVFPIVLGAGDRLFGETNATKAMRLVDVRTLDGDTTYLIYERVQDAKE
jgi:dihydrofolate reductase